MKISEIIQAVTDIQLYCNSHGFGTTQAKNLCRLVIQLSAHVQQLEIDMKSCKSHFPPGYMEQVDKAIEKLDQKFDVQDAEKIKNEVIQAARWYTSLVGNSDRGSVADGLPTEEYQRLLNSVRVYNATVGKEEPLKEKE